MHTASRTHSQSASGLTSLVQGNVAVLYLLLSLLGVLPLVLLTPPFQVPDEHQHFFRAYHLSELGLRATVLGGAAGAVLPSSLPELANRFLGTRAIFTDHAVRPSPLLETLAALSLPLDPTRREFVDFTGTAFYSPLPYLPQVAAIAVGRQFGLGPLGLFYAARLANGLTALLVMTAAFRILPVGAKPLLVLALLPMTLFLFASSSPDGAVIAGACLFTAVAMRARFRGSWLGTEIAVASVAGAVFCSLKPTYTPLLVLGLPAAFRRGSTVHVILAHAALLTVALGATAAWLSYTASSIVSPIAGTDLSRQVVGIVTHPGTFAVTVVNTVLTFGPGWVRSTVGMLGWMAIPLPWPMYLLPVATMLACLLLPRRAMPSIGWAEVAWYVLLLISSLLLIFVALYLYWNPVGASVIRGVQGRYFLPLSGLVAVTLEMATPLPPRPRGALLAQGVLFTVVMQVVLTSLVILQAYSLF